MRILSPQVGLSQLSGGGRYDFELLAGLARQGQDVLVMLPRHVRGRYPVPVGCQMRWAWARWGLDERLANLAFFGPLLRAALRFRPDVIRLHSINCFGLVGLTVGRMLGIPTVAHFHHRFETSQGLAWTEERLIQRFTHVITDSESSRRQLLDLHPGLQNRCAVVYPGIAPQFQPSPEAVCDFDQPLFLSVGVLIPRKNVRWLIDLMAAWVQSGRPGTLVVVGDGPEREELQRLIAAQGLAERVRLLGRVDEQTNVALLQAADVFLLPSLWEGFGFAPAEALACGTPAIVSDRGSLPEIVRHEETGFVLSLDRGLAPWIDALETLTASPARRAEMARLGRHDVQQRFNWDEAARQVVGIYEQVLPRRRKGVVPA